MTKELVGPTVDVWRDTLGQEFTAGDLIAVATISGRSPQMVVAEVIKINTHNSKGERHTKEVRTGRKVVKHRQTRTWVGPKELERFPQGGLPWGRRATDPVVSEYYAAQRNPDNWHVQQVPYETDEYKTVQAVTVTARPVLDGRGFGRSDASKRWVYDADTGRGHYEEIEGALKTRPSTYSIIGNIIRLSNQSDVRDFLEGKDAGRRKDLEW